MTNRALWLVIVVAILTACSSDQPAADGEASPQAREGGSEVRAESPDVAPAEAGSDRDESTHPAVEPTPVDHGPRDAARVALTFDADMTEAMRSEALAGGPDAYDRAVVERLRELEVPATIFVTGLWAETHPDAVRSFAEDELFEVANHTHDHAAWTGDCYGLPSIESREEKRRQVTLPTEIIEGLTGEPPHWFRFPGLCHEPEDVELVASLGQQVVDGDVSSGDAFNPDAEAIAATTIEHVRPGSIVVMHLNGPPNAPATAEALEIIVPELRARGYELVTLTDLLAR